jgi:hypothetical protein
VGPVTGYPAAWSLPDADVLARCGTAYEQQHPEWKVECSREGMSWKWRTSDPQLVARATGSMPCALSDAEVAAASAIIAANEAFFGLPPGRHFDLHAGKSDPPIAACGKDFDQCIYVEASNRCAISIVQFLGPWTGRIGVWKELRVSDDRYVTLDIDGHLWPRQMVFPPRMTDDAVAGVFVGRAVHVRTTVSAPFPIGGCRGAMCPNPELWSHERTVQLARADVKVSTGREQVEVPGRVEFRTIKCANVVLKPEQPPTRFPGGEVTVVAVDRPASALVACVDAVTGEPTDDRGHIIPAAIAE